MKEKIYLEKKDGKIIASFVGKKITLPETDIDKARAHLEKWGHLVELKE